MTDATAHAQDAAIDAMMARLMAPGAPLEPGTVTIGGNALPTIAHAPPTLPAFFAHFCGAHHDKPLLVDGDTRLSFGETLAAARALASALISVHGIAPGDRVAIAGRNSANYVIAYMGVLMAGGVVALLNGFWTGEELGAGARMVGCRLILADDTRAARLNGVDRGDAALLPLLHDAPAKDMIAAIVGTDTATAEPAALPAVAPEDPATILFTSGSTGKAKGALSCHRAVVQGAMSFAGQALCHVSVMAEAGKTPLLPPATLLNVPLFHITGEIAVLLQSFAVGRKIVMMPKWDALEAMRLIEAEKVTYFTGVPLMSIEMMTHPERHRFDLSSCTMMAAGGAPRPAEHVARIKAEMGEGFPGMGYGLTETNAVGCTNLGAPYVARPESTGRATPPTVDLAIFDDAGQLVAQGERGEIAIRSAANFEGYWNDPEATAAAVTADGYFLTGDIGYLDADGYLFIVDRKKDIIIRGGENISCAEVEAAGYAHPDIAELSVFPVPDARLGEVPGLVFLAKPGTDLTAEALAAFLAGRLAPYQRPAYLWPVTENLPRLGTAKIDRVSLKRDYAARVAATVPATAL